MNFATADIQLQPNHLQSEQARALLKALADPLRLQVIEALGGGERCVCDLTADLGLAQSKLSFHLKVLKEAGLLADRQEGRWIYYSLRPEAIEQLRSWLAVLGAQCSKPASPCS
jgi:ArsR family transcriptional regulator